MSINDGDGGGDHVHDFDWLPALRYFACGRSELLGLHPLRW